ncbi:MULTISPECIES: cell division protein FtsA [unclassified Thalassospira]|uniref:cell division protein FtsA n=1 Tax=unclassified Thalassospira TaxID=2648997 RepID=UPI0007A5D333|nr:MULTISPECIES: cell division protein FtsA [unclassified Thalassospira]KZC99253.1 cell division protein FtsA [Thalassospira sp. MCCC 1A02898]ONH88454.1 cell division protein FtsA [Thalassospira sp. MCCC 1A02803]
MARGKTRSGLIAALDIGTSKVCCFIARREKDQPPKIIGIGHNMSKGLQSGSISNLDAAQEVVLAAVNAAEKMAGQTIDSVIVNLSGGRPESETHTVELPLGSRPIGNLEIRKLNDQKEALLRQAGDELIHTVPLGFRLDGANTMNDPRGMYGSTLGLDLHFVRTQTAPLRNLGTLLARCHLAIEETVVTPLASGLSALTADQRDLGATVIDMGAGTTSVAVFNAGQVVYTTSIPVGGAHVTRDIAYGLNTSLNHAERMKTLHGSALTSPSDDQEILAVPTIGDEDENNFNHVPRSMLINIIKPRLEETFELIRDQLEEHGLSQIGGRSIVLTGGASQLNAIADLASQMFERPATIALPHGVSGLAEATAGPAFSACSGLLLRAVAQQNDPLSEAMAQIRQSGGRWGRLGAWLKENF